MCWVSLTVKTSRHCPQSRRLDSQHAGCLDNQCVGRVCVFWELIVYREFIAVQLEGNKPEIVPGELEDTKGNDETRQVAHLNPLQILSSPQLIFSPSNR
eukprot:1392735-Amorphochlora_amoeboformis.AAC.1